MMECTCDICQFFRALKNGLNGVCVYTPFENLPPWIDAAILGAIAENRDEVLPDAGQDCAAWQQKED
jgi:hypothetical protein